MPKRLILCFASWYLPGFYAGGPVRSLARLCEWLQDDFEFRVVTRDRDLGCDEPYPGRADGQWYPEGEALVTYVSPPHWLPLRFLRLVKSCRPDLLYFHSFLDPALVITPLLLRRLGLIPPTIPVLIAPRGEFSPGALRLKSGRKKAWFALARLLGVYRNVVWQATDDKEVVLIRAHWGDKVRVLIAPNLPPRVLDTGMPARRAKQGGVLRLAFLSRISPMKNLRGALEVLAQVKVPVSLDIYGTKEDMPYWNECEREMGRLPAHITASYQGVVLPDDVLTVLAAYDAFLLPTLGENFGHVILEALLAGSLLLISDRTPWRQLEARCVGFDLPVEDPRAMIAAIERLAAMDDAEFQQWSRNARECGLQYSRNGEMASATRQVIESAMAAR